MHCAWTAPDSAAVVLEGIHPTRVPVGAVWGGNANGELVGSSGGATGFDAVRWRSGVTVPAVIEKLPGAINGEARAINDAGVVVGRMGFPDQSIQAFRQNRAGEAAVGLPHLPRGARYAEAFGVNQTGWVVGTASAAGGQVPAVLWIDGRIIDLNDVLTGGLRHEIEYLTSAVAVANDGTIAARAMTRDGRTAVARLRPIR